MATVNGLGKQDFVRKKGPGTRWSLTECYRKGEVGVEVHVQDRVGVEYGYYVARFQCLDGESNSLERLYFFESVEDLRVAHSWNAGVCRLALLREARIFDGEVRIRCDDLCAISDGELRSVRKFKVGVEVFLSDDAVGCTLCERDSGRFEITYMGLRPIGSRGCRKQ